MICHKYRPCPDKKHYQARENNFYKISLKPQKYPRTASLRLHVLQKLLLAKKNIVIPKFCLWNYEMLKLWTPTIWSRKAELHHWTINHCR